MMKQMRCSLQEVKWAIIAENVGVEWLIVQMIATERIRHVLKLTELLAFFVVTLAALVVTVAIVWMIVVADDKNFANIIIVSLRYIKR